MAVSAPAKPRLNARTRLNPKPILFNAMAPNNTTNAEGHGNNPPETPRASRLRKEIFSGGVAILPNKRHGAVIKNGHDHGASLMNDDLTFVLDAVFADTIDTDVEDLAFVDDLGAERFGIVCHLSDGKRARPETPARESRFRAELWRSINPSLTVVFIQC